MVELTPTLTLNLTLIRWSEHYSSNLMTAAVLGRSSLETLEQWAIDSFSAIPDRNLTRPAFSSMPISDRLPLAVLYEPASPSESLARHLLNGL